MMNYIFIMYKTVEMYHVYNYDIERKVPEIIRVIFF